MTQYSIVAAPSKFDLAVAFFDGKYPNRRSVKFTLKIPNIHKEEPISVVINQLAWEDGSGESWCFQGYITTFNRTHIPEFTRSSQVKGYFKTTDRKGWIQLI